MTFSLRTHYILYSVLLLTAIILLLAYTSHNVKLSSEKSLDSVDKRRTVQIISSQIRDDIWQTDFTLNVYLFISSPENKTNLLESLNSLITDIDQLARKPWSTQQKRKDILDQLNTKVKSLEKNISTIIDIREHRSKRFPTLSILQNKLYPISTDFITLNTLVLEDASLVNMSAEEARYYNYLTQTLRLWHRMISSFRLFVAYRSESINNPISGMNNALADIHTLFGSLQENLQQLRNLPIPEIFTFQSETFVADLTELSTTWYTSLIVVGEIHTSNDWRKDDKIIQEQLQPISKDIRALLYALDHEIDQSIQQEISSLNHLANNIILNIWLLGFFILLFIITGYFYLKNYVLNPISGVASGLELNTIKTSTMDIPVTSSLEVKTLITAFNELSLSLTNAEAVVRQTDKMSTVGELASCVAHEINNPLNNMSRIVEFAREEIAMNYSDQSSLSNDMKILLNEIDRCAAIVKNLLDFGRLKEPTVQNVSLSDILNESILLLTHKAEDNKVSIETSVAENLPNVIADPSQIHQVFVNLILNAIDFSPANETIKIIIEVFEDDIRCLVIDHGPGVDKLTIEKLFDPFYTSRKGHEGMGLGLSVCYGIIEHHQGKIGARIGDYDGLVVWFSLPIAKI